MALSPLGMTEGITLQALKRIRGEDLKPVPRPGEEPGMALPGETVHRGSKLPYPGAKPQVCVSPGGYFIGYTDKDGTIWTRESVYFTTPGAASRALASGEWERR